MGTQFEILVRISDETIKLMKTDYKVKEVRKGRKQEKSWGEKKIKNVEPLLCAKHRLGF